MEVACSPTRRGARPWPVVAQCADGDLRHRQPAGGRGATARPLQAPARSPTARISGRAQVDSTTANETASATVQAP
ncbi:MAG: hypothetical protein U0531_19730 [Dehalococcoidia bacterium]